MNGLSVGMIGAGRVARILLGGWTTAASFPQSVIVADPDRGAGEKLRARFPLVVMGDLASAARQDIVLLGLHPPALAAAFASLRAALGPGSLVISLAPKITLAELTVGLGTKRVARVIPNAPSIIGAGYNPVTFECDLGEAERSRVRVLLSPLGEHPEVAESKLETYAVLTAMGPTYFWFQLQTLRELAIGFGLEDEETCQAIQQMLLGSARTLFRSSLPPTDVMDLVAAKPIAELEPGLVEQYRNRLTAVRQKIAPSASRAAVGPAVVGRN